MDVVHERCAGLDVHKAEVVACVRFGSGRRVRRIRERFPTTTRGLLALAEWLAEHGCRVAALEATGVYWKPVWHVLEASVDLLLANPAHVRTIPGRKSDMNDAMWLADLLAHGLIRGSFVPPPAIQEIRDLTRTRKQLVRQVAQHTLRLQKTLEDANIKVAGVVSDLLGVSGRALLRGLIDGETDPDQLLARTTGRLKADPDRLRAALEGRVRDHHRFLLQLHLDQVTALERGRGTIDARLGELFRPFEAITTRLRTMRGVSHVAAQTLVAEARHPIGRRVWCRRAPNSCHSERPPKRVQRAIPR